jgi:hypothetical protein
LDLVRSVAVVSLLALAGEGVAGGGWVKVVSREGVQVEAVAAGPAVIVIEVVSLGGRSIGMGINACRGREKRKGIMVPGRLQVGLLND